MTVTADRHIAEKEFAVEDISTGIFASGYGQFGDGRSFSSTLSTARSLSKFTGRD
jgi:hypothetical protein